MLRSPYAWVLWIGLAKLLFFFFYFSFFATTYWANQVYMDIWAWTSFWKQCQQGLLPYLDFSREYPHLIGLFFYLLHPLFDLQNPLQMLMVHALIMLVVDLGNTALFIKILRDRGVKKVGLPVALLQLNLTALFLSPFRFESLLLLFVLLGFVAFQKQRWLLASLWWSLGFHVKWFTAFLLAVQFLALARRRQWRQALGTAGIFVAVTGLIFGSVGLGIWLRGHSLHLFLAPFLFHLQRNLYWDTVLGVVGMWFGPIAIERWASLWSLLGMIAVLGLGAWRRWPLASQAVLISVAMLVLNRVYSPQFHLWFYPFLILVWLQAEARPRRFLAITALALELSNIAIYPFTYTYAYHELRGFGYNAATNFGGPLIVLFSLLILLRAALLVATAWLVWWATAKKLYDPTMQRST